MPQLRKSLATQLGVNADVWRLESVTIRRDGSILIQVNGFLEGADLVSAAAVAMKHVTLEGDAAGRVRAQLRAPFQSTVLAEFKAAMIQEFSGATEEP
jgi:hypothetical protein